jgi:hypothetical protein
MPLVFSLVPRCHGEYGSAKSVLGRAFHQRQPVFDPIDVDIQRDDTAGLGKVGP